MLGKIFQKVAKRPERMDRKADGSYVAQKADGSSEACKADGSSEAQKADGGSEAQKADGRGTDRGKCQGKRQPFPAAHAQRLP